jgi:anti-sigma B factor antagonist
MLESAVPFAEPIFSVEVLASDAAPTVLLTGELDLAGRDQAEAVVDEVLADGPGTVVIDLSGLEFIDSTGIQVLLRADRRARAGGVRIILVPGPDRVHRVFRLCGLDTTLPFAGPRWG